MSAVQGQVLHTARLHHSEHGCTLTVINLESLSPPAEMVEDWMAIIDTFAGRLHGLRSYRKQIR